MHNFYRKNRAFQDLFTEPISHEEEKKINLSAQLSHLDRLIKGHEGHDTYLFWGEVVCKTCGRKEP